MKLEKFIEILLSGGVVTVALGLIGNGMGWLRFSKKDKATVAKVESETQVDIAEVVSKRVDDEVKISKAALEWAVQLAGQLEKANSSNDKRQIEIDRLHSVMQQMREDFEKRMDEMEAVLIENQKELSAERIKNKDLLDRLNTYLNGGQK